MQEYEFTCEHRPGVRHQNADALSRRPVRHHGNCPSCLHHVFATTIGSDETLNWSKLQSSDTDMKPIYDYLLYSKPRPTSKDIAGFSWEARCLWFQQQHLRMEDRTIYYQFNADYPLLIVVPETAVKLILEKVHLTLGHAGQKKVENALRSRYWWPHLRRDVYNFCSNCDLCAMIKSPTKKRRAPLLSILTGYPNELIEVDAIGPLPETQRGNRYIIVMVDHFTKWCEAIPMQRIDAISTARCIFNNWICRWGAPKQIHSDRGSNFESAIVRELCYSLGIKKSRTTAYHPQGNGVVERTNRTLKSLLQAFTNTENTRSWDLNLPQCLFAYRAGIHSSTRHTPHFMTTGREMRLPIELSATSQVIGLTSFEYIIQLRERLVKAHQLAREHLRTTARHQKAYYDKSAFGLPLAPGDRVWLRVEQSTKGVPAKFIKQWVGPYLVHEVLSETTCSIRPVNQSDGNLQIVHFNRLKPDTSRQFNDNNFEVAEEVIIAPEGGTATALVTVIKKGGEVLL